MRRVIAVISLAALAGCDSQPADERMELDRLNIKALSATTS